MNINVLIVDDIPLFGDILNEAVSNFISKFDDVFYKTTVIAENNPYEIAEEYILNNQSSIDIMLFDYNIESYRKGTDLFKLVDTSKYLIYKILHSITTKAQNITKEDYKVLYNEFCSSKDAEDITKELQKYEDRVLELKLYGNKSLRSLYYTETFQLTRDANEKVFGDIRFADVLYAHTDGGGKEQVTVYFRNPETGSLEYDSHSITSIRSIRMKDNKTQNLHFVRINTSFLINMLWVSKVDTVHKRIRFMLPGNTLLEFNYEPALLGTFKDEVEPLLPDLDGIPPFLSD